MAISPANDRSRGVDSPLDSMRERIEVTAAFQQWLRDNGHTDRGHCPGCAAYYGHRDD